jgi:hypothetical protein
MCLLSGGPTPYFKGSKIKTKHRDEERSQKADQQADKNRSQKKRSPEIQG